MNIFNLCALAVALSGACSNVALAITPPADLADWTCTGQCGSVLPNGDVGLSPTGSAQYGYVTTFESFALTASIAPQPLNAEIGFASKYVSSNFAASKGDVMNINFNFVTSDGKKYGDFAWARLISGNTTAAWLFSAQSTNSNTKGIVPGEVLSKQFDANAVISNIDSFNFKDKAPQWSPLGDSTGLCYDSAGTCGHTGWLNSRYTFANAGSYQLEVGVANMTDFQYQSGLAFDFQNLKNGVPPVALSPVPEPATYSMLIAGLAMLGAIARRRSRGEA